MKISFHGVYVGCGGPHVVPFVDAFVENRTRIGYDKSDAPGPIDLGETTHFDRPREPAGHNSWNTQPIPVQPIQNFHILWIAAFIWMKLHGHCPVRSAHFTAN
jgi:hypothetical protein